MLQVTLGRCLSSAALIVGALTATVTTSPSLAAQGDGVYLSVDEIGPTKWPERLPPGYRPDIPMPPRVLTGQPPAHKTPAIPDGPETPQNDDPPGVDIGPDGPQPDTGQFRYFTNRSVQPGGSRSTTGEPSAAMLRDTAFYTGNWYAGLSKNSGYDWEYVSPYSFFPAIDGGFCCDQRILHARSKNVVVWLQQYSYSSTTQQGSYRLSVANRDALRSDDPSEWNSYIYNPGNFGLGTGNWLDFPDIAFGDDWVYITANVFNAAGSFVDAVRFRVNLDDMIAGTGASMSYRRASTLVPSGRGTPGSLRLAEGGDGSSIFYAAFRNTTTLYIWETDEATSVTTRYERSINNWRNVAASCPGPDGRDWCGRVVGRLRGGFGDANRVGWIWTSAADAGNNRPLPYSRIATFDVNTKNKLSDNDQWSSSLVWAYGAGDSNSRNEIGLVFAVGGPNSYVRASCTIVDQYQTSFGGMTTFTQVSGNSGPSQNRWGDYLDVHRHPNNSSTFIATGMRQNGGSGGSSNEPRFVWFGRDDYEPTFVDVDVRSTPVSGVSITVDIEDINGNQNGSTTMTRTFAPRQGYALTAPSTHTSGSAVYVFDEWALATIPTGTLSSQGSSRVLEVNDIGNLDDVAEARYLRRRTLTVRSTNPSSGVPITVSLRDINGLQNGSTTFSRNYKDGASVTLTAPASRGFNPFRRWVINGVPQRGSTSTTITMNRTVTAVAEYFNNVGGSVRSLGAGCRGTNGRVPTHSITWPAGQQGPQQGAVTNYRLANARPFSGGALHLGVDATQWNGFTLPLNLVIIGMPNCFVRHSLNVSPGVTTDASGSTNVPITWPVDPTLIGSHIYSTYAVIDPGANSLGVVHSNSLDLTQGGNQ